MFSSAKKKEIAIELTPEKKVEKAVDIKIEKKTVKKCASFSDTLRHVSAALAQASLETHREFLKLKEIDVAEQEQLFLIRMQALLRIDPVGSGYLAYASLKEEISNSLEWFSDDLKVAKSKVNLMLKEADLRQPMLFACMLESDKPSSRMVNFLMVCKRLCELKPNVINMAQHCLTAWPKLCAGIHSKIEDTIKVQKEAALQSQNAVNEVSALKAKIAELEKQNAELRAQSRSDVKTAPAAPKMFN